DIKRLTSYLLLILKDVLIYKTTRSFEYLETIDESDAQDLSKLLEITKCNAYIDKLMEAEKDYKNVPSINPLFEITILKMTSMVDKSVQSKEREIIREKVANTKFKEEAEPS
ncbi:MAG: hypothetical protein RBR85_02415, partial [Bacilli bacterium]|nr:hypothetical protein [Bacilli bacterium]